MTLPHINSTHLQMLASSYFGYQSLWPIQEQAALGILNGRDVFVLDRTGGGKTLCFLLPAMAYTSGIAIIISPLIQVMRQISTDHQKINLPVASIDGMMEDEEVSNVLAEIKEGKIRALLVAPERFDSSLFQQALKGTGVTVNFVAVDEGHCVSLQGHDFRPPYLAIRRIVNQKFGAPPLMTLTGTASTAVQEDMQKLLGLKNPLILKGDLDRPNLVLKIVHFQTEEERAAAAMELARKAAEAQERTFMFHPTINEVNEVRKRLGALKIEHTICHAKLEKAERFQEMSRFDNREADIMASTSILGMGINYNDIRNTIHCGIPFSPEDLWQQIGRAGRDGKPAVCHILWTDSDLGLPEQVALGSVPDMTLMAELLEHLHRNSFRARNSSFPTIRFSYKKYIEEVALNRPVFESRLQACFAAMEEYGVFSRDGLELTLPYSSTQLISNQTPLTSEVVTKQFGTKTRRVAALVYFIAQYTGRDSTETRQILVKHLENSFLEESAGQWWEAARLDSYAKTQRVALQHLNTQDALVLFGLGQFLRGVSKQKKKTEFHGKLKSVSMFRVNAALELLVEEGFIRRTAQPTPIFSLTKKGIEWLKTKSLYTPTRMDSYDKLAERLQHPESLEILGAACRNWFTQAQAFSQESLSSQRVRWQEKAAEFLKTEFPVLGMDVSGKQIIADYWKIKKVTQVTPEMALRTLTDVYPGQLFRTV